MLISKDRGYLCYWHNGIKQSVKISDFETLKDCLTFTVNVLRKLIEEGYVPSRKSNRTPCVLPCGRSIPAIAYVVYTNHKQNVTYSKFNVTYPDINKNKSLTKSFHIERGGYTGSYTYRLTLERVSQFLYEKRQLYREHLLKEVLLVDVLYPSII